MKYRKLTLDELQSLEKEFIDYLVVNTITADDWVKIKKETPQKAEQIIELFSDIVFDRVLQKTRFMEYRSKKELFTYQCLEDKIVLVGLSASPGSNVDFSDPEYIEKAVEQPDSGVKIFTTEKLYTKERELEIFDMLQKGCEISDGRLFKILCLAL